MILPQNKSPESKNLWYNILMKTKIMYLHGYGSSPDSDKVKDLRKRYEVVSPSIPVTYRDAYREIYDAIVECSIDSNILLVGTSLGGYWATIMSRMYSLPALIINPSCDPGSTIGAYRNPLLTPEELSLYRPLVPGALGRAPKIVALAKDDELLDYRIAESLFEPVADVRVFDDGGHRFQMPERIASLVDEMLSTAFFVP